MGRYNRLSIHYGYNFNILNTFKMGLFKKLCSHIPSKMDPSRPPGVNVHTKNDSENCLVCIPGYSECVNFWYHIMICITEYVFYLAI